MSDIQRKALDAIEHFGADFEQFKGRYNSRVDDLTDRLEQLESVDGRPRATSGATSEEREHTKTFTDWLRNPRDHSTKNRLAECQSDLQHKAVTIGTNADGGFTVPAEIARQIESRVVVQNPWRSLVRVVNVGTSSYTHIVSRNAAGSGWVGEGGTRSETGTSSLIACQPTFGTIYSYPKASEESMADIFFDVQQWLVDEVSDGFSAAEATAIWSGNGSNRPSGIKNTTPSSTADGASPERSETALEYKPLGGYTSPETITIDSLIDLVYGVKEAYLTPPEGVAFVMRRATAAVVRKLKDTNGAYHWQPATVAGQPDTLLGYPVFTSDAVDAIAAGNFPVAFGAWRRAYLFTVRQDIRITIDDNITTPGQVKFYVRRRVGGKVLNNEAAKLLKYAAS